MSFLNWVGILNITKESFSDGGNFFHLSEAVAQALKLEAQGAHWIDVGGVSTKPGSVAPPAEEEWNRVAPVLRELRKVLKASTNLSIDTFRASVALKAAHENLVDAINDVCAGDFCEVQNQKIPQLCFQNQNEFQFASTVQVAAQFNKSFFCMHMQNSPDSMQNSPKYDDVIAEVASYLKNKVIEIRAYGVSDVWIDPGIGFGKSLLHNLELLSPLAFKAYQQIPAKILIGLSRKNFLKKMHIENGFSEESWSFQQDIDTKLWEARCAELGAFAIRSHVVGFSTQK